MVDLSCDELTLVSTIINNLYAASVAAGEDPGLLESISIKLAPYAMAERETPCDDF